MVCHPNSAQTPNRFSLTFLFHPIPYPLSPIPYPLSTVHCPLSPIPMPEQSKLPQRHPQENIDRAIVNQLLESDPKEAMALAELARLLIRYRGFPGAAEIQANLERILTKWQLTEEELFAKTRELHNREQIYQVKAKKYQEQEDWN
jgi:Protein of unknown function (DUF3288)